MTPRLGLGSEQSKESQVINNPVLSQTDRMLNLVKIVALPVLENLATLHVPLFPLPLLNAVDFVFPAFLLNTVSRC